MVAQVLWKIVWHFLKKGNVHLLYVPDVLVLVIYPREIKANVYRNTCTRWFMAVSLVDKN